MSIGENIKNRRRDLDMTLEQVADRVGLSRQTLSRYETGVIKNIPSDKIELLAKVLDTTPMDLMGWKQVEFMGKPFYQVPAPGEKATRPAPNTESRPSDKAILVYERLSKLTPENLDIALAQLDVLLKHQEKRDND